MPSAADAPPGAAFCETQWMVKNPWFAWVPALFFVMYTSGYFALWLRGAATDSDLVLWAMTGVVLPAVLCTWRLRTEVVGGETGGELRVSLPPVWGLSWRVELGRVIEVEEIEYKVFDDFGAFGVRRTKNKDWAWNAHGTSAVRVKIQGSADRIIGTQRAEDLVAALGGVEAAGSGTESSGEKLAA